MTLYYQRGGVEIWHGDCLEVMPTLPQVNLVVTSPPYAEKRGFIKADKYADWFLPRSQQMFQVLASNGTFILNIKEHAKAGERSIYVIELILALRQQGWLWTEEFIWCKKNCYPGKWPNRFRDSWERLLQFNKRREFKMYQDVVMVPVGDWAQSRLVNLSDTDTIRDESKVNSGFGKNVSNWAERDKVYPTNVLHLATECENQKHSATFPVSLPAWFVKLFTLESDLVLDPFLGSGTTLLVCTELNRRGIGIEIDESYCEIAARRVDAALDSL